MSTSPLSISSTRNGAFTAAQERSEDARVAADAARLSRGDVFSEHLRKKATSPNGDRRLDDPRGKAGATRDASGTDERTTVVARRAQDADRSAAGQAQSAGHSPEADAKGGAGATGGDRREAGRAGADSATPLKGEDAAQRRSDTAVSGGELDEQVAQAVAQPLSLRNLNHLLATIDPKLVAQGVVKNPVGGAPASGEGEAAAAESSADPQASSAVRPDGSSAVGGATRDDQEPTPPSNDGSAGTEGAGVGTSEQRTATRAIQDSATINDAPSEVGHAAKASAADVAPVSRGSESATPTAVNSTLSGSAVVSSAGDKPGLLAGADAAPLLRAQHADLTGADAASVAGQVSRGLAAALKQQGGQVTLRLRPEALGHVRIELNLQPGLVDVRFVAGSAQAQALLKGSLDTLKESLERQGLTVGSVQVDGDDAELLSSISQARKHADAGRSEGSSGQSSGPGSSERLSGRSEHADQTARQDRRAETDGGGHGERNPHSAHDGAERPGVQSSAARSDANLDDLSLGVATATRNGVLDVVTLRLDAVA